MCKITKGETYGYPHAAWEAAKKEAICAILERAQKGQPITYGDLTKRIGSIGFEPQDFAFHNLLGDISVEEDAAGRGMLSVMVVHQHDGMPGQGFFDLAKELGRDVSDQERFWSEETHLVLSNCAKNPLCA